MSAPTPSAGPSTRQWIILLVLFLLSLPAVTPRIYSSDEIQYFAYLRSAWFDHDLSFENEYQYFYDRGIARSEGFHETFLELRTDTGRRINYGTIGCAILWTPFYAAGDLVARATGAPRDGFSKPYIASVAYGSAVYGFLALVLAILCARRLGLSGVTGALAVWLGTPLVFYMYVAPPYSHACSAFGVALFTYVWLRTRETWSPGGLLALGATGALMAMIREQDLFFAGGPALDFALWALAALRQHPNNRFREGLGGSPTPRATAAAMGLVAAAAGFAAAFAPQAATYLILNGHLGPHASVAHKMNWRGAHALQVLLSPEHGFFIWTPLALVAIAGLVWLTMERADASPRFDQDANRRTSTDLPRVGLCLLVMVALQMFIGGSVNSWTVAGAFGQRRFVALTTAMVIGYAALARRSAPRESSRRVLAVVTIVAVYWNLALIAEFATGLMDRQKLEPGKNAYDAFVTLPVQAPTLAYRYLFDRASFYKHGS